MKTSMKFWDSLEMLKREISKKHLENYRLSIIQIRTQVYYNRKIKLLIGDEEASHIYKKINRAYEILSDPDKR